jgi:hypothetical protein
MKGLPLDLLGQHFGRWTVLYKLLSEPNHSIWWCICECGKHKAVRGSRLRSGESRSCGCLAKELSAQRIRQRWDGDPSHPLYTNWTAMKNRCLNPNASVFRYYGLRGIKICDRWRESFLAFVDDMRPKPTSKHTLDRIDNDGDYEPGNCRWATQAQQLKNRRLNVS